MQGYSYSNKAYASFKHPKIGKRYWAVVHIDGKNRLVRHSTKTASASVDYGRRLMSRYENLLAVAAEGDHL